MQEVFEDKVEYTSFNDLGMPNVNQINVEITKSDLQSKDWKRHFQTLTHLRKANKYYGSIFVQQLLPQLYRSIISQIDNLRSNNSKQALTLVSQFLYQQNLELIDKEIVWGIIGVLFSKAVCEKAFLRNQALKAINILPTKSNNHIVTALISQTQSQNSAISELAIKILQKYFQINVKTEIDDVFLKGLCRNLNGKRPFLQRTSKEILNTIKAQKGEEQLESIISSTSQLTNQESNTLRNQLKRKISIPKTHQSFKEFMKNKQSQKQN